MGLLAALTIRSVLSGSDPNDKKKRGPLGIFLHLFNQGVELVTNFYAGILRRIVTLRTLTMLVIAAFTFGIYAVNNIIPPALFRWRIKESSMALFKRRLAQH